MMRCAHFNRKRKKEKRTHTLLDLGQEIRSRIERRHPRARRVFDGIFNGAAACDAYVSRARVFEKMNNVSRKRSVARST